MTNSAIGAQLSLNGDSAHRARSAARRVLSVASHELRTPINVIQGYVQLLEEETYGPLSPAQRDVLRTLDAQTESLGRLVGQLLDVGRYDAGGGKLELNAVDLGRFVQRLDDTFRVLAFQKGVEFVIERGVRLPTRVLWDEDRMNEVLGICCPMRSNSPIGGGASHWRSAPRGIVCICRCEIPAPAFRHLSYSSSSTSSIRPITKTAPR